MGKKPKTKWLCHDTGVAICGSLLSEWWRIGFRLSVIGNEKSLFPVYVKVKLNAFVRRIGSEFWIFLQGFQSLDLVGAVFNRDLVGAVFNRTESG